MGVPYNFLIRNVAIRISALTGATQPNTLEAAYTIDPLTATDVQESAVFGFTAIKDAILHAEMKTSQTIAEVRDHPWRASLISQTDILASGVTMPAFDENGLSIIGVYGQVSDAVNDRQLFEQPIQVIDRHNANAGLWKMDVYYYSMNGDAIVHTRPSGVRAAVCVWDYLQRQAAINANDDMLLPDALAESLICGALAILFRDDEWLNQAGAYAAYFSATLDAIRGGSTNIPIKEAA